MDPEAAVRALGSGAYLRGEMSREEALAAIEYTLAHLVSLEVDDSGAYVASCDAPRAVASGATTEEALADLRSALLALLDSL